MGNLWKENLDKVQPYKPGKPVAEVKRQLGLDRVIKLASNENPLGPSPKAAEQIRQAAAQVHRYPDGGCYYLRSKLSQRLGVPPEDIVFGNGSDELIVMAARAFLRPGEQAIISHPTFLIYEIISTVEGAEIRTITARDLRYDLKAMKDAITSRTRLVFIANPDNPTGTYVDQDELEEFIACLPEHVVLFIDEAYYEFARGDDYPETFDYTRRTDCNVIVSRTFSKAYGLAGLRLGYAIARSDIAKALNKVREPFNVNSLAQVAACSALDDTEHLQQSVDLVRKEKARFYEELTSMDVEYTPSRANFILVNTKRDSTRIFQKMLERGVIIRDMSAWGMDRCVRVNMGLPQENDIFFKAFSEVLKEVPLK